MRGHHLSNQPITEVDVARALHTHTHTHTRGSSAQDSRDDRGPSPPYVVTRASICKTEPPGSAEWHRGSKICQEEHGALTTRSPLLSQATGPAKRLTVEGSEETPREGGGGGASLGHGWGPRGLGPQEAPLLHSRPPVSLGHTCSFQGCLLFRRESPGPRFPC